MIQPRNLPPGKIQIGNLSEERDRGARRPGLCNPYQEDNKVTLDAFNHTGANVEVGGSPACS
jgi:hypothetical protein